MRRLLLGLTLAVLAMPASGVAGGWATAGLGPPDDGIGPGDTWNAKVTILQHGMTPLSGLHPTVTIQNGSTSKTFRATATDEPGVYLAKVVFPSSGTWSYSVYDGFTQYGGAQTHGFPSVSIGVGGGDGGGFPVLTTTAVFAALLGAAGLLFLLVRRLRVRAPAPTH
jgi:YtkA-like